MTFPTINYKYNGIEEAKSLASVVDQKLESLHKFIPEDAAVVCEVEFEKLGGHVQGRIHRVEANLTVNGHLYRAEATENTFEEAIDVVRDELDTELSRAKDKQVTQDRSAGREVKEQLLNS
ncbi:MAG: Sigma 54 modulation protein / ribosomal protein [Candidatus Parcubacteria bacterium]|jgi:ribosomal subunit interface protein